MPGLTCMKMADGFWAMKEKIYEISNPEFSVFVPDKDHTPSLWTKDFPLP